MANIRATNINDTSARGVIEGLAFTTDYYDLFEIELWDYNLATYYYTSSWIDSSSVNNYTYMDFSGLGVGTGYGFKAFAKSGGNRNYIGSYSFYTTSPLPLPGGVGTISVTSSPNSLAISWNSATNYQWYDVTVRIGNSGGAIAYSNNSIFSTSVTVSGLSSNTVYWIEVKAGNSTGNGTPSTTTASTGSSRPSNWNWSTLNPNATSYTFGKLRVNLVSATDWNDFCSRINEFRRYKGKSSVTFTSATSSSDFTNAMYLEAVNAIGEMTAVSEPIGFYSKLIALKDSLNSL